MISHKIFTLKNGMDVLFLKRPEQYSVYADLLLSAGSLYESKDTSGASHFFEHLMFDGSKSYPSEQAIRDRQQELGMGINASTGTSTIQVQSSFPKSELESALGLLKEIVFESTLSDDSIQKERGVILEEQHQRRDHKYTKLWELMMCTIFNTDNPLSMSPGGTSETVKNLTPEVIRKFYQTHVSLGNTSLVIGANLSFDEMERILETVFAKLPTGKKVNEIDFTNKEIKSGEITSQVVDGDQQYMYLVAPSYAGNDITENWCYSFMRSLLFEELNTVLRIEKGLVYSFNTAAYRPAKSLAISFVTTSCHPDSYEEVMLTIAKVIKKIKEQGFNKTQFERIRESGNKTLPMTFDTLGGAISWCVDTYHDERKVYSPEEVLATRNSITIADLNEKINEVFQGKKISCISLGPLPEKKANEIGKAVVKLL